MRTRAGRSERASGSIEFALLVAFVGLACAGLFVGIGENAAGVWSIAESRLGTANSIAHGKKAGRYRVTTWGAQPADGSANPSRNHALLHSEDSP